MNSVLVMHPRQFDYSWMIKVGTKGIFDIQDDAVGKRCGFWKRELNS